MRILEDCFGISTLAYRPAGTFFILRILPLEDRVRHPSFEWVSAWALRNAYNRAVT